MIGFGPGCFLVRNMSTLSAKKHHVRVTRDRLDGGILGKWRASCTCGWGANSWSWSRQWDYQTSGLTLSQFIAEGNHLTGGALPMALEHVYPPVPKLVFPE